MIRLLLVCVASIVAAMVGRHAGGARWSVVVGAIVGLVAGGLHATEPTLSRVENGDVAAFIVFGMPSILVGLGAGLAVRMTRRHVSEGSSRAS